MNSRLEQVLQYCNQEQINLTSQQVLIIKVIVGGKMPLTAQDILVQLRKLNPKANRMTIHRALEHLVKIELIHKIAFNHTYALCEHLECAQQHLCQILVCQGCGTQIELHQNHLHHALQKLGRQLDFTIANQIEITGTCLNCSLKRNNS